MEPWSFLLQNPQGRLSQLCMQEQETLSSALLAGVPRIWVALSRKELDLNTEERNGKRKGKKDG